MTPAEQFRRVLRGVMQRHAAAQGSALAGFLAPGLEAQDIGRPYRTLDGLVGIDPAGPGYNRRVTL